MQETNKRINNIFVTVFSDGEFPRLPAVIIDAGKTMQSDILLRTDQKCVC